MGYRKRAVEAFAFALVVALAATTSGKWFYASPFVPLHVQNSKVQNLQSGYAGTVHPMLHLAPIFGRAETTPSTTTVAQPFTTMSFFSPTPTPFLAPL